MKKKELECPFCSSMVDVTGLEYKECKEKEKTLFNDMFTIMVGLAKYIEELEAQKREYKFKQKSN